MATDNNHTLAEGLPISRHRLDEYYGFWSIEESRGAALVETIRAIDFAEHLRDVEKRRQERQAAGGMETEPGRSQLLGNGIALIEISGTLMKQESSFGGTSSVTARRSVQLAANDPKVQGIMLLFDSPGGSVAGIGDLADAVAAAAKVKPLAAYCEDMCASAAYRVAAQAPRLTANADAMVGSIGTYTVVRDTSGVYAKQGVKTYVVKAGDHKAAGVPGTEITAEQLAELQRTIDAVNQAFVDHVATGRKLTPERAQELADGRVHIGKQAQSLGLIDGIESFDQALGALAAQIQANHQKRKGPVMSNEAPAPAVERKAATIAEIKASCPGASSDFVLAQAEKGATVAEAMAAYILAANEERTKLAAKVKEQDELLAKATEKAPGVEPKKEPSGAKAAGGSAREQLVAIAAEIEKTGKPKHEAWAFACRKNEALRVQMIEEENAAR